MLKIRTEHVWSLLAGALSILPLAARPSEKELDDAFRRKVRPFLDSYCLKCHDADTKKADLDLSRFTSTESVLKDYPYWELVLERLENGDMPPAKSKQQPGSETRKSVIDWIQSFRQVEAHKYAGDPGPVPARRLSNAEYDYTIRDLTGVDLRPTRAFPVDPANQAGFDNSGESLATSPALVKKYLQAAREVAEHLVLLPDGFIFADHPMVADTDRDKWAVFRIVEFYRRQPTDLADYFEAAWQYRNREALGRGDMTLAQVAGERNISPKYLSLIWSALSSADETVGPLAKLQTTWRALPPPSASSNEEVRTSCEAMRNYVLNIRREIIPEVKNLTAPGIHSGSQTFVMWKNRQMAANRRRFDATALRSTDVVPSETPAAALEKKGTSKDRPGRNRARTNHVQAPTPEIVQKGGISLAPTLLTKDTSATERMVPPKSRATDPELSVPDEGRAEYEAAFGRFASLFPDAFYITERGRVYLDAEKEQENAGRLLSAGLHSMTGYFRDDRPLYDLILDDKGRKELDRLWDEFDFVSSVPQRMHTSLLWFERTDSGYLRDTQFDPYRPEDKSAIEPDRIRSFAELYLEKARKNDASEVAQKAIADHFASSAANVLRVETERLASIPRHLEVLERFAAKAYRRPLTEAERGGLRAFHEAAQKENGGDHEEAMRDCIMRILMSPHFSFRMDLVEAAGGAKEQLFNGRAAVKALSLYALASRLSYFLWASMPDEELLRRAASGDLSNPEVVKAEARRLLKDNRVRGFTTEFAGNWLDFRRFEQHNSVDRERFPAFNNELRSAMFEEPIRFFLNVAQSDRSVLDLIYGKDTFVNRALARHYGMSGIAFETTNPTEWVHVPDAHSYGRGGLLPMGVFLTANSPGLRTSPVKRGNWVVKRILGERIPPPPPTVPELPSDEKKMGDLTLRAALARHRDNPACAGCHAKFDSFGLVFESFGPIGELRDKDLGGRPVDTRAEFPGGGEGSGLNGLVDYIHEHREKDFIRNFCRKLLAYALGRTLILSDEPLLDEMADQMPRRGYRLSSLVECIVTSPQFLTKRDGEKLARN